MPSTSRLIPVPSKTEPRPVPEPEPAELTGAGGGQRPPMVMPPSIGSTTPVRYLPAREDR